MICQKEGCIKEAVEGQNFCSKSCRGVYCVVVHYEKKRRRAREMMGGKCAICGYCRCDRALEFHHVDPSTKEKNPARLFTLSWENIQKELNKCVLLCANCHREVHEGLVKIELSDPVNLIPEYKIKEKRLVSLPSGKRKKVDWPDIDTLIQRVNELGYSATGRQLGVCANSVKKHMRKTLENVP